MNGIKMIYVTADYCGPCRSVRPIVAELTAAGWDIETIDADKNKDFVIQNQIAGIPTFILYKNGVQVNRFTGARDKRSLLSALQKAAS